MTEYDDNSDESSSIDAPPPPPTAGIVLGGEDSDAEAQETPKGQTDIEKYHEQLKIFKNMADFSILPGVFKDDRHFPVESKEYKHNDRGGAIPPTKDHRTGKVQKCTLYAGIASVLMLIIILILGVGIGIGGFK